MRAETAEAKAATTTLAETQAALVSAQETQTATTAALTDLGNQRTS